MTLAESDLVFVEKHVRDSTLDLINALTVRAHEAALNDLSLEQ